MLVEIVEGGGGNVGDVDGDKIIAVFAALCEIFIRQAAKIAKSHRLYFETYSGTSIPELSFVSSIGVPASILSGKTPAQTSNA